MLLSVINPYNRTLRISCPTKRKESLVEYEEIKNKIKSSTLKYGSMVSAYHFIFQDPVDGLSATLGTLASYAYVDSLSSYVDNIEKSSGLNKRMLIPVVTALLESSWNSVDMPFDFNMGATLFGFLAYKVAFYQIVAEELLLLKDGEEDLSEEE